MSNDPVVAAVVVALVAAAVGYLAYQRRRGLNSCGCKGCDRCSPRRAVNVTFDEGDGKGE